MGKSDFIFELKSAIKRYIKYLLLFFIGICVASLAPDFLGKEFIVNLAPLWIVALIVNLILYYFLVSRTSIVFWSGLCVGVVFGVWAITRVSHYYLTSPEANINCNQQLSILYANVLTSNQNKQKLNHLIKEYNPDIVALVETDKAWIDAIQAENKFPYLESKPLSNNFGISLFSKLQIVGPTTLKLANYLPPIIHTLFKLDSLDTHIQIVVFHTFPPQLTSGLNINPEILEKLNNLVQKNPHPLVMAGDLNATSFSNYYWKWINNFNVVDTMSGFGIYRTWHAQSSIFRLTLDYIFTSKSIKTKEWKRLEDIGSDHYPIFAKLCLEG